MRPRWFRAPAARRNSISHPGAMPAPRRRLVQRAILWGRTPRRVTIDYGLLPSADRCRHFPDGAVRGPGSRAGHAGRASLILEADYSLNPDGSHHRMLRIVRPSIVPARRKRRASATAVRKILGRSLAIRQWTPARVTAANWKSPHLTIPFTISNVSAFTLWHLRVMRTCCW